MRQNVRFYPTLAEASQATIVLGITTSAEYKRRYKEDPRLPANPNVVYKAEWQGWPHFLDKPKEPFYRTLTEASQATIALGITTRAEYKRRYKEDPRLPAEPNAVYKAEWQGWPHFLDKPKERLYRTLTEASQATIVLGITTSAEYKRRYKEDPRLPANPNVVYKAEWQGWSHFLDKPNGPFYRTLTEASQATIALGITTHAEYNRRYKEDPRLPSNPNAVYKAEWQGWPHFLDKPKERLYRTLTEASQATIALGITTRAEYKRRYKEDPRLPAEPSAVYKAEWQGWPHFLDKPKERLYRTLTRSKPSNHRSRHHHPR